MERKYMSYKSIYALNIKQNVNVMKNMCYDLLQDGLTCPYPIPPLTRGYYRCCWRRCRTPRQRALSRTAPAAYTAAFLALWLWHDSICDDIFFARRACPRGHRAATAPFLPVALPSDTCRGAQRAYCLQRMRFAYTDRRCRAWRLTVEQTAFTGRLPPPHRYTTPVAMPPRDGSPHLLLTSFLLTLTRATTHSPRGYLNSDGYVTPGHFVPWPPMVPLSRLLPRFVCSIVHTQRKKKENILIHGKKKKKKKKVSNISNKIRESEEREKRDSECHCISRRREREKCNKCQIKRK